MPFWKFARGMVATPQQRAMDEDRMYLLHDKCRMGMGECMEDLLTGCYTRTLPAQDTVCMLKRKQWKGDIAACASLCTGTSLSFICWK